MKDFWLACGHHLLDRNDSGGLVVTDDFLKIYLARPELVPPPESTGFIHRDLKAEALRDASLDRALSITDADLAERIHQAFSLHPWVARVDRVTNYALPVETFLPDVMRWMKEDRTKSPKSKAQSRE